MNRAYLVFTLSVLSDLSLLLGGVIACFWTGPPQAFDHHLIAPSLIASGASRLTSWALLMTEHVK